jgi:hypothetical protein
MGSIPLHFASRALATALFAAMLTTAAWAATAGAAGTAGNGPGAAGGDGAGPGGGGPPPTMFGRHGANGLGSCGGHLELPPPPPFADAGDAVKALSRDTQRYLRQCQCETQQCVADALDQYAQALAVVAPRLPPDLQDLPNVVARAARRVRIARTKAAAVSALQEAIGVIHKDISLVRAEDPEASWRETRSGTFVADTLNVASLSLERAGGL